MSVWAWPKSAAEIVDEISVKAELEWDTDSSISILMSFIEEYCSPHEFRKHVEEIARLDLENSKES